MVLLDELAVRITADGVNEFQSGMARAGQATTTFQTSIASAAQNLQRFGQVGFQAMSVMDRFQISNISVQNAMTGAANAQIRYNQTINDFGEGSQQAILASNQLEQANRQVESANTQAKLSFAAMGLGMIGMIPQIISLGTVIKTEIVAATASVTALRAALVTVAPVVVMAGVVIGGMYYLWQQNKVELDKNTQSLENFKDGIPPATENLKALRAEIEKPVSRPSLMDVYNENVTGNASVGFGRRSDSDKERYKQWSATLGFGSPASVEAVSQTTTAAPAMSYEDRLREIGLGWAITPPPDMNPNPGMPYAPRVGGSSLSPDSLKVAFDDTQLAGDVGKLLASPRQITVINNITIDKSANPLTIGATLGEGIGNGIDSTRFRP